VQEPEGVIVEMLPIANLLIPWRENDRNWSDAGIASAANFTHNTALGPRAGETNTRGDRAAGFRFSRQGEKITGPVGEPATR
jgi:hypothetical protein